MHALSTIDKCDTYTNIARDTWNFLRYFQRLDFRLWRDLTRYFYINILKISQKYAVDSYCESKILYWKFPTFKRKLPKISIYRKYLIILNLKIFSESCSTEKEKTLITSYDLAYYPCIYLHVRLYQLLDARRKQCSNAKLGVHLSEGFAVPS